MTLDISELTSHELQLLRAIAPESLNKISTELLKKRLDRYISNGDIDESERLMMKAYRDAMNDIIVFFKSLWKEEKKVEKPLYKNTNVIN